MRAPPESLRPTIGAPTCIAWSMILQIFSACASESAPPNTVKSWLKANTSWPSTVPHPVTTPSPGTRCSAMPKSCERCSTNMSHSSNEPGSNSSSSRSRAVSLPLACCCAMRRSPPPRRAAARFSSNRRRMSCMLSPKPPCSGAGISPPRWERQPGLAGAQQLEKPGREPHVLAQRGAAASLLLVLAPLLDLEALVELRQGEGGLGVDSLLDERQRQHHRAAGRGGEMERRQRHRVMRRDRGPQRREARLGLRPRHDPGGDAERRAVARLEPIEQRLPGAML